MTNLETAFTESPLSLHWKLDTLAAKKLKKLTKVPNGHAERDALLRELSTFCAGDSHQLRKRRREMEFTSCHCHWEVGRGILQNAVSEWANSAKCAAVIDFSAKKLKIDKGQREGEWLIFLCLWWDAPPSLSSALRTCLVNGGDHKAPAAQWTVHQHLPYNLKMASEVQSGLK